MKQTLIAVLFLFIATSCYASKKEAESFAGDLPLLFWYTLELWSKEPRGTTDSGFTPSEYVSFTKAEVVKLKESSKNSEIWEFKMFFTDVEDDEGWTFVFLLKNGKWEPISGYKIMGTDLLNLYQGDFFSKSMKPQMKKSLDYYNIGKLDEAVRKIQD